MSQLTTMEFETSALLGLFCYSSDFQLELSDMDILVEKDSNLLAFLSNCFSKSWKYNVIHIFTNDLIELNRKKGRRAQTEMIFFGGQIGSKNGAKLEEILWPNWQKKVAKLAAKIGPNW